MMKKKENDDGSNQVKTSQVQQVHISLFTIVLFNVIASKTGCEVEHINGGVVFEGCQ